MKKIIHTDNAPAAVGPYSQAVEAGGVLWVSGQIPVDPATGLVPETIEQQTAQCMENVKAILTAAGYTLADVVKSTVLLADMADFSAMNGVYAQYYTENMPARVCFQAAALPRGVKVEIDAMAMIND